MSSPSRDKGTPGTPGTPNVTKLELTPGSPSRNNMPCTGVKEKVKSLLVYFEAILKFVKTQTNDLDFYTLPDLEGFNYGPPTPIQGTELVNPNHPYATFDSIYNIFYKTIHGRENLISPIPPGFNAMFRCVVDLFLLVKQKESEQSEKK